MHIRDRDAIMNFIGIMMRGIEKGRSVRILGIQVSNLADDSDAKGFRQATLE